MIINCEECINNGIEVFLNNVLCLHINKCKMSAFPQVEGYQIIRNIGKGSTSTVYLAHVKVRVFKYILVAIDSWLIKET